MTAIDMFKVTHHSKKNGFSEPARTALVSHSSWGQRSPMLLGLLLLYENSVLCWDAVLWKIVCYLVHVRLMFELGSWDAVLWKIVGVVGVFICHCLCGSTEAAQVIFI